MSTLLRRLAVLAATVVSLLLSAVAQAAPLTLLELDLLQGYVDCTERCALGRVATQAQCLQTCGTPKTIWKKNTDAVVNRRDYELGLLEYADNGTLTKICYESTAVVPKGRCGGANCLATHTAAECADKDADGIKAWQETLASTSDTVAQTPCTGGLQCNGFAQECFYEPVVDVSFCKARAVSTAFHLEKIEENAEEVSVALVFDYSPVPPTVLDLFVTFNGSALTLTDSRALAAAKSAGKEVQVRQVGDNLLRVIALGAADARTIKPGRIAELVFRRKTGDIASIQFSTDATQRKESMAPAPGAFTVGLGADSAWGPAITTKSASDPTEGRTLLHYDFDSAERPLALSTAKTPAALCDQVRLSSGRSTLAGDCPPEPAVPAGGVNDPQYAASKQKRDRWISQLGSLQAGTTVTTRAIEGVNGSAAWFDGENDHVAFPLTFNQPAAAGGNFAEAQQSFSLSFWVYREPGGGGERVLYSRNTQTTELTQFALLARPNATQADKFDLVWVNGALSGGVRTVVHEGLAERKWTHIGISVAGSTRQVIVHVDGKPAVQKPTVAAGGLVSCPSVETNLKRVTIHQEGDFAAVQGTGPESLFFSAAGGNGLYGIDAADPNGLGRHPVVRVSEGSVQDPDYNPVVDRLVYSSNESGSSEIWLARGDGSQPRRITASFGSTADGIFARKPRWAPDGSGIVFESNAFDIDRLDNLEGTGYQLYYIGYDATKNEVAIAGPNNTLLSQLDYEERVGAGDIGMYRLTRHSEEDSNTGAQWLAGRTGTGDLALGELAFTSTDAKGANPRARRLRVAKNFWKGGDAAKELLSFTADPLKVKNKTLLAARAPRPVGQPVVEKALLAQQEVITRTAGDFTATIATGGTCANGAAAHTATIKYVNTSTDDKCWDVNRNKACDASTEDRNGDATCNVLDCNISEFEALYVQYDRTKALPDMTAVTPGTWLAQNNKKFRATQVFGASDAVRVEVTSPINAKPIPTNTGIVTIRFCGAVAPALALKKQIIEQSFSLVTTTTDAVTPANNSQTVTAFALHDTRIQRLLSAEFSPDLNRLALGLIFDARPTLFRTANTTGTAGSDQLISDPVRIEGISWSGVERMYSCNWIGATRNPTSKLYQSAFQGGLEDVKLVDYVRTEAAFTAESERGHERLVQEGRDNAAPAAGTACTLDSECTLGDLCTAGKCEPAPCVPTERYACARGRCQRLPVEFSATEKYACVTECQSDSTCMEQQCANGPCRFCDATARTCSECRPVVEDVGGLTLSYIQGCPDRNSFACDRGSCVSACYAFANGESKYLCDSATEYCRAGRCVLFDWSWVDFGPMSMGGLGEMVSQGIKPTAAISQLYPIEITALGVADMAHPPEIVVEGKVSGVFGGNWFDIGRIVVDNETNGEAMAKPYVLNTPYPITNLRLRQILPPYENLTNSAMGLQAARTGEFCTGAQGNRCRFAATGTRAMMGYEGWIPGHLDKCKREPGKCNVEQNKFLAAGTPVALVLGIKIKGQEQSLDAWVNKTCPYWDGTKAVKEPVDGQGNPYRLIYGDASREISNQKTAFYPSAPASTLQSFDAKTRSFAVLNCNYLDDVGAVANIAGLELVVGANVVYPVGGQYAYDGINKITETANGCQVDLGTPQQADYRACYEWDGAHIGMDPFGNEAVPVRTFTIEELSGFGWGTKLDSTP